MKASILTLAILLGLTTTMMLSQNTQAPAGGPPPLPSGVKEQSKPNGLKYWDIKAGTGQEATFNHTVRVHYTGWLTNGKKFDSSVDRGEPFEFKLGAHQVIQGWDEGVAGMKVGGKRRLQIPQELGYGARGAGGVIPPNATLVFDVELLDVR